MNEYYYNNFTIGESNHFGSIVFVIRPSEYAHDLWGEQFGNQYGELGMEFWGEANTQQEAEAMVDMFVADLEAREVA